MTDAPNRPKARAPRGFVDRRADALAAERRILEAVSGVYESYGFEALETGAFEYADALGKFLPDADRPNEGVFALRDDDEEWMALRYDLTAPLARFVAQNWETLPKPFRRYAWGKVWRDEKPGPGRWREFVQCDADTVGSARPEADAEIVAMAVAGFAAAGLPQGRYVLKINNRKLLNGLLTAAGVAAEGQKLAVLRAVDKLDRLGLEGVKLLLGAGRKDESGAFTRGAELTSSATDAVLAFVSAGQGQRAATLGRLANVIGGSAEGEEGLAELARIGETLAAFGIGDDQALFDPSVVRGLEYYTGAVFEAELLGQTGDDGQPVSFGSIGGGGRYDDLVARFTGERVPATGFSFGVSRLAAALARRPRRGRGSPGAGRRDRVRPGADGRLFRHRRRASRRRPAGRGLSRRLRHARADEVRRPPAFPRRGDPRRGRDRRRPGDREGPRPRPPARRRRRRQQGLARGTSRAGHRRPRRSGGDRPRHRGARAMRIEPPIPPDVLAAVRAPFAELGAEPIDPPVAQPLGLILDLSGEAMRERLILVQADGGAEAALRPDFTIPAARLHIDSGHAGGRYFYEGKAFRASPRGREAYEEFLQIGLEAFETGAAPEADAEIAGLAWRAAAAGGRTDLTLELGDVALFGAFVDTLKLAEPLAARIKRAFASPRRLREALQRAETAPAPGPAAPAGDRLSALLAGLPEAEAAAVLQDLWALAGIEPAGGRSAAEIVHRLAERAAVARAPDLTPEQASLIGKFLAIAERPATALEAVARLAGPGGAKLDAALKGWSRRLAALKDEGAPEAAMRLTTAFGRDFGYYDGVLFEVRSAALGDHRPVAAGGRYDSLFARLGASLACGAVGCMVRPGRAWREGAR